MTYELEFLSTALKEWKKLDGSIRAQFKKKLEERLENPCVPGDQLSGYENHYKIKLRASGYRLVYEVIDERICVQVIAIGRRDKSSVYMKVDKRKN